MQAHEYCGQGDPSQEVLLYRVETAAAATAAAASKVLSAVPRLPSGTLVSALPAAIISQCQASRCTLGRSLGHKILSWKLRTQNVCGGACEETSQKGPCLCCGMS